MTLQCIESHNLEEITETKLLKDIYSGHIELLKDYRHVRYMWIPYADKFVIAKSNPPNKTDSVHTNMNGNDALEPLRKLLRNKEFDSKKLENIDELSFSQLRDRLIDISPLDTAHIKLVNQAEAQFWNLAQGVRVGSSDEILGFDCGGQQWVLEMAFPTGTLKNPTYSDLNFVMELKSKLEEANIPAPAPIEQRWTSSSTSYMSPAYSENSDELFSWVGIIMYLPPGQDDTEREKITRRFEEYADIMHAVGKKYGAVPHWAKIELPDLVKGNNNDVQYSSKLNDLKGRVQKRYDIEKFNSARNELDPDRILSNHLIDTLFE
jgi:L-galactono-1,4-lactone dehydrogenase